MKNISKHSLKSGYQAPTKKTRKNKEYYKLMHSGKFNTLREKRKEALYENPEYIFQFVMEDDEN